MRKLTFSGSDLVESWMILEEVLRAEKGEAEEDGDGSSFLDTKFLPWASLGLLELGNLSKKSYFHSNLYFKVRTCLKGTLLPFT